MRGPYWLDPGDDQQPFPPVELALREPDGLLAVGGTLAPQRLLRAYRSGIFPWYEQGQPLLWWSPDPRCVLWTDAFHCSRSLAKALRRRPHHVTADQAFGRVVAACAAPRPGSRGTWITPAMARAYQQLHELGAAHSLEVWDNDALIGGIYGVALGRVFFGESMFSQQPDGSKFALAYLARQLHAWGFPLLDCQIHNPHLESLGAVRIPRRSFTALLDEHCDRPPVPGPWQLSVGLTDVLGPRPQRLAIST